MVTYSFHMHTVVRALPPPVTPPITNQSQYLIIDDHSATPDWLLNFPAQFTPQEISLELLNVADSKGFSIKENTEQQTQFKRSFRSSYPSGHAAHTDSCGPLVDTTHSSMSGHVIT